MMGKSHKNRLKFCNHLNKPNQQEFEDLMRWLWCCQNDPFITKCFISDLFRYFAAGLHQLMEIFGFIFLVSVAVWWSMIVKIFLNWKTFIQIRDLQISCGVWAVDSSNKINREIKHRRQLPKHYRQSVFSLLWRQTN